MWMHWTDGSNGFAADWTLVHATPHPTKQHTVTARSYLYAAPGELTAFGEGVDGVTLRGVQSGARSRQGAAVASEAVDFSL